MLRQRAMKGVGESKLGISLYDIKERVFFPNGEYSDWVSIAERLTHGEALDLISLIERYDDRQGEYYDE